MDVTTSSDFNDEVTIAADDLTTKQVAERLGITQRHVARLLQRGAMKGPCRGALEGRKVAGLWFVPAEALERFEPNPTGRPPSENARPYNLKRRERYRAGKQHRQQLD